MTCNRVVFGGLLMASMSLEAFAGNFGIEVQKLGDSEFSVRNAAFTTLLISSSSAIPDIIAGVETSPNASIRAQCLRLIWEIHDQRGFDVAKKAALSDPDWETQQMAIDTLFSLKRPEGIGVFEKIAKTDPLPNIRVSALSKYVKTVGVAAVPVLKTLLLDPNPFIQVSAAFELAWVGDKSGYAIAKGVLNHKSTAIRRTAISAIAYAGGAEDVALMKAIAGDPKESILVKRTAAQAVKLLELYQLTEDDQLTKLRTAMSDPDRSTRIWAAKELLHRSSSNANAILVEVAGANGHPGQLEAIQALKSSFN